jgi:hypothetical protein
MRISASFVSLSMPDGRREQMLDIDRGLHADHQGMVRDKMRAR